MIFFLIFYSEWIGKFTISAGNTVMPVYTAELYPTAIRNAGVGACNVAAGVALIIVPYLSLLVCKTHIYGLSQCFFFAKFSIDNKKYSLLSTEQNSAILFNVIGGIVQYFGKSCCSIFARIDAK